MSTSLVDTSRTLEQLIEPLTKGQKDYLRFLVMGMTQDEALKASCIKTSSLVRVWRQDENFAEVETFLTANREKYHKEALTTFVDNLGGKSQMALNWLVDLAVNPDNTDNPWLKVKQGDKPYILQAIKIINPNVKVTQGEYTYDEMILKLRRERRNVDISSEKASSQALSAGEEATAR